MVCGISNSQPRCLVYLVLLDEEQVSSVVYGVAGSSLTKSIQRIVK